LKPLTFALIGCGDIAQSELDSILKIPHASVSIVMDSRLEYAKAFGQKNSLPFTDSYEEVLASMADVVVLAVPHYLHRDLALKAAAAGKHIVLEKPIATNHQDALDIITASKKAGIQLSIAYVQRYNPIHQKARELVRNGALGSVFRIQASDLFTKPASYWTGGYSETVSTDWRANKSKSGGGVWIMNMSHTIDYLLDITGLEPVSVYAVASNFNTPVSEVEDDASAIISFKGGSSATLSASTIAVGNPRSEELLLGTQGTLIIKGGPKLFLDRAWETYPAHEWITLDSGGKDPWQDSRDSFFSRYVDALNDRGPVPISGEEALKTLEIVLATYESASCGRVVRL